MANSQLIDKTYKISDEVVNYIRSILNAHPIGDGVRRAKFIINNRNLTYQALKRIKHDLENANNKIQYALAGGDLMLSEINKTLGIERAGANISVDVKRDSNINVNSAVHAQQNPRIYNDVKSS